MQRDEASTNRMSGTYVRAPVKDQAPPRIQRTASQVERTARVIQEALMEAAASVRNRSGALTRGRQIDRKPEEPASPSGSSTSPRKAA